VSGRWVSLPGQLRAYSGGRERVLAEGETLAELLADLERQMPGIRFRMIDEQGRIRRHLSIFVGPARAEHAGVEVGPGVEVFVVGALSGG
jgi:molybdopterin converting factor small subunit